MKVHDKYIEANKKVRKRIGELRRQYLNGVTGEREVRREEENLTDLYSTIRKIARKYNAHLKCRFNDF